MNLNQNQDFALFSDNSILPAATINQNGSLTCTKIGYVQGTSPAWLLVSLIENSIARSASLINRDLVRGDMSKKPAVVFVSFLHPRDFYTKLVKRVGLDLDSESSFHYVDCFTDLFTDSIKNPANARDSILNMFRVKVSDVLNKLQTQGIILFIESPETLLYCTDISASDLSQCMFSIASLANKVFVVCAQTEAPMISDTALQPDDAYYKLADFLVKLTYQSHICAHLEPLATGRAVDITGCLTICRGSLPMTFSTPLLVEREYVYHVSNDMAVSLSFR